MIIRSLIRSSRLPLSRCLGPTYATHANSFTSSTRFAATPIQGVSGKSTADEKIEEIQELYATAKDEFEIACEETDKKTVYAADDRAAASEELAKLKATFEEAVKGEGGSEIQRRVGQRIRELDNAVLAMEERAKED